MLVLFPAYQSHYSCQLHTIYKTVQWNLPSWTMEIYVGELLEYLAGPFSVARYWARTDLNHDISLGSKG
jgi:hypothetical protein